MHFDMEMTYKTEADFLKQLKKWLEPQERNGVVALPIRDNYTIGYSDLFICVQGRMVVAELKDDTGVATPHQLKFIKRMQRAGALGGVCRSIRDVADLIDQAKCETNTGREWSAR